MKLTLLILAALSAIAPVTAQAQTTPAKPAVHVKAAKPLICPVTGTKIASADKAYDKETYKGKTYYFCCPMCKPTFDKDRDGTLKNAAKGKYKPM